MTPAMDGLPVPRRYWAMAAMLLTLAIATIDASVANLALPTIAREMRASAAGSIWVVIAYQISIGMVLLPFAAAAEIIGYRRVYISGVALFVVASLGCAISPNLPALVAARFVQGLGAAAIYSINAAVVRFIYPRAVLARGMSYNAFTVALTSAIGPSVAAAILSVASWRWLFAINLPIGAAALTIGFRTLPEVKTIPARFDAISTLLNIATFGFGFLAIDRFVHAAGVAAWTMAAASLIAGTALVRRSRGQERPLVPLDLLRIGMLRLSYATSSCSFAAQTALMVTMPFYLQLRFGFDHALTGLLITPMPAGIALASLAIRVLIERVEAGLLGGIGLTILAVSAAVLAMLPVGSSIAWIAAMMAFAGFGFGLFQTPNNRTMLSLAPVHRSGAAAGMLATARLFGQTGAGLMVSFVFRFAGPASNAPILVACGLAILGATFSLRRLSVEP